ncbi:type I restriction-modification enzyme R subunit C-terminal domain-containing protein [Deinococcus pimensis]|uniref:type I restriction endonuclease subunit R n=1 Tax=Deinococcus pimensis TaxID=309888 RepID=UPI0004813D0B|nr:type I restriction-modification enzyme R subunit C-terminal domain-containing protein [Deinococcus pimensis]
MTTTTSAGLTPEQHARQLIDQKLAAAGWVVQNARSVNFSAARGVALREVQTAAGPCDYMLFVDRVAVGVIEAKPRGTSLVGVAEQTEKYLTGLPAHYKKAGDPLPFAFESNGQEVQFRDLRDPDSRSRSVFHFHRPETLGAWTKEANTLRARLRHLPELTRRGLRDCQFEAITNLEQSLAQARPRALIQMTMGSGKSYTAVASVYRLLKYAKARRVLFLVDRGNLGKQALGEFANFDTPDDNELFTKLYPVQHLTSNVVDPDAKVVITTIQRLYSMLHGDPDYNTENEERSEWELGSDGEERPITYNPRFPIETFDVIITDECHRSIYGTWRQVLEYFDAFLIGLTATPSKQTIGFFDNNLVMEYGHERAVVDGVNVNFDVFRIRTRITEHGSKLDAGTFVDYFNRETREVRWEQLDDDLQYQGRELDRSVVAIDQIRTVIKTWKDHLPVLFPGRDIVPKTLIFAKDDAHADRIVEIVRDVFGKGNDFCKKITYGVTGERTDTLISQFRNEYNPRIVVTVDMIATGTDVKPLECLIFMRDVKSRAYYEQMKGRGTRVIDPSDLQSVTADAPTKTRFILVDAVGVTESDKGEAKPLERKRSVAFDKLLQGVATGDRSEDTLSSLAGRLARLNRTLTPEQRADIVQLAAQDVPQIARALLDALDPDKVEAHAQNLSQQESTPLSDEHRARAAEELRDAACLVFDNAELRELLVQIGKRNDMVVDHVSVDGLESTTTTAGESKEELATRLAQGRVQTFKAFIEANKDELDALRILYSERYAKRHVNYRQIRELAKALERQDPSLTTEGLWDAYERLEASRVRGGSPRRLLTDLVSLVRFATEQEDVLVPFGATVQERFDSWLKTQEGQGRAFTPDQRRWLEMIRDHITTSLLVQPRDLSDIPFNQYGGIHKARELFGDDLPIILQELNEALAA